MMINTLPVPLKAHNGNNGQNCIAVPPSGHCFVLFETNEQNSWDVTLHKDLATRKLELDFPTLLPTTTGGNSDAAIVNEALQVRFINDDILQLVTYSMCYSTGAVDGQRKLSVYFISISKETVACKRVSLTARLAILAAARPTKLTCLSRDHTKLYWISDDMDAPFNDPSIFVWHVYETNTAPSDIEEVGPRCLGYVTLDGPQAQRLQWEARDMALLEKDGVVLLFALTPIASIPDGKKEIMLFSLYRFDFETHGLNPVAHFTDPTGRLVTDKSGFYCYSMKVARQAHARTFLIYVHEFIGTERDGRHIVYTLAVGKCPMPKDAVLLKKKAFKGTTMRKTWIALCEPQKEILSTGYCIKSQKPALNRITIGLAPLKELAWREVAKQLDEEASLEELKEWIPSNFVDRL